jgi:hypothetical protein
MRNGSGQTTIVVLLLRLKTFLFQHNEVSESLFLKRRTEWKHEFIRLYLSLCIPPRGGDPLVTEADMPRAIKGEALWTKQAVVKGFPGESCSFINSSLGSGPSRVVSPQQGARS